MFTLSACNLVVTDKSAYYSQIIATYTYGDKEFNVSMDQLNTAFKEYGYNNYINGYYSTITDCLNDCLKYHIQSSLLTYELETKISEIYAETNNELYNISFADIQDHNWQKTLDNIYTSTNPNALEIRYNAFANMQSSIDSYCVDILEEEERFEEIKVEEEETLRDEKTEYVSKLVINETTGKVTRKVEDLKFQNHLPHMNFQNLKYKI